MHLGFPLVSTEDDLPDKVKPKQLRSLRSSSAPTSTRRLMRRSERPGLWPCGPRVPNAAHRVAVCWDSQDGQVTGVYVSRRDTSSRLAALAGGRLFPGWQHRARFEVQEHEGRFRIQVDSRDGVVHILVAGHLTDDLAPGIDLR